MIAGIERAVAEMGRLDCVIANAGIQSRYPSFLDMPTRAYHDLLAINLHGAVYTLREGARHVVARAATGNPGGSLIAVGASPSWPECRVSRTMPRPRGKDARRGSMSPPPSQTPTEAIEEALTAIASRLSLVDGTSPSSHTVMVSSGLDDAVVAESLALYAVAFLAGWVQRDATIGDPRAAGV